MTSKTFKYVVAATTGVVFALGATFTTLARLQNQEES